MCETRSVFWVENIDEGCVDPARWAQHNIITYEEFDKLYPSPVIMRLMEGIKMRL
jgi:hypothetical protein